MRLGILVLLLSMAAASATTAVTASPRLGSDYGVFCVHGRLAVDPRRIEELKAAFGEDVCRLEQDATETGAREKILRLGGAGSTCVCD